MASQPLIDTERLSNWLGLAPFEAESVELKRAQEVIATISGAARSEARREWTSEDVPEGVASIVLMVAVECYSNPDNKTSVTIEEVTRRWNAGELFSPSQLSSLRAYRPGQVSGIGTVQFERGFDAPSIAVPGGASPRMRRPSSSAVRADVVGGNPAVLYDGRGY